MKILFSASTYPHPGYPFSAFIKVLCEELARQGHEVTVIAPQSLTSIVFKRTKSIKQEVIYTVKSGEMDFSIRVIRPYALTFAFHFLNRLTWWCRQQAFCRTVRRKQITFDVVYAHFWNNGYNALPVVEKTGKPLFVATGEDKIIVQNVLPPKTINRLRDFVRGVICVSNTNKEESIKAGLTRGDNCIVLPNAINPVLFYRKDRIECRKKLGFSQKDFIVAFCGRFNKRKGVDRLSSAIKLLNDKNIKSIFIGTYAGNEIIDPNCDGILFKGPLEQKDIADYLNSADVFVLPSLAEGCSNSIIEAMACGLPVISSSLPFNYDICNKDNSILVDPMDIHAIADAIIMIMDNKLRKHLSEGAMVTASGLVISERAAKIVEFIKKQNENIIL